MFSLMAATKPSDPTKDRLVGDSIENDEDSTEAIKIVPRGKDPMADLQMQLKRGMDLVSQGSRND